jgi:hypothetical protein
MNMDDLDGEYFDQCRNQMLAEQSQSLAETSNWAHVDRKQTHADWDSLYREIAPLIDDLLPGDEAVQELMARHYEIASRFYKPSREAYIGMGLFYMDNQDMRDFHNGYHPKMAEFLGDAVFIYARNSI